MSIYLGENLLANVARLVGGFVTWETEFRTSNFQADINMGYFVDTSGGGVVVTLPQNPEIGNILVIMDATGSADETNEISFVSNDMIEGSSENKAIAQERFSAALVYSGEAQGWVEFADANPGGTLVEGDYTATNPTPMVAGFSIDASGTVTLGTHNGLTTTLVSQSPEGSNGTGEDRPVTVTYSFIVPEGWPNTGLTVQATTILTQPFTTAYEVDFLVVAGGGAGGSTWSSANFNQSTGAGGAGGLRTSFGSTSGGGAVSESPMMVEAGATIAITVGNGAVAAMNSAYVPAQGSSAVGAITGNITTIGGGTAQDEGAFANGNIVANLENGGSGAGASGNGPTTFNPPGAPTAGQGYGGGNHSGPGGGGGGGAGAAGGDASGFRGGAGGNGLAVNIISTANAGTAAVGQVDGTDVYFAGGGAGGNYFTSEPAVPGGLGGGGGNNVSGEVDGTPNTGGGGQGGNYHTSNGGAGNGGDGGSGVVILRMATSDYSGTSTAQNVFTEGNDTVLVFKQSGSYTG